MTKAATEEQLKKLGDNLRASITEGTREVIRHFNQSQGEQNRRLERMETELLQANTKLDAIMSGEVLVTRKQMERLLRALKAKGIELDEADILAA